MSHLRLFSSVALIVIPLLAPLASAADPSVQGIPNFHQVNARLFRGGQPSALAWPGLSARGVSTVIDLCRPGEHDVAEEARAVEAAGMRYVNIPLEGFAAPSSATVTSILEQVDAGDTVFVHCKRGMDRTGTVVAAYRIARERWTNQKALDEAVSLGMHWYSSAMKRFILGYRAPGEEPGRGGPPSDSTATPAGAPGGP